MNQAGTTPDLILSLQAPEAYPHAVSTPIRLAETHISWVLLTGEYAYKIKKPLRLSFLDYSTLDRRQAFCEEEVRLNRRYAPDLYLGVSAIAGSAAAPRVDGPGSPVEYAVRMRQFDPREELDALLVQDDVAAHELSALGEHIARFHAEARPVDRDTPYGRPETVRRVTLANFEELRRLPEATTWTGQLRDLEQWVRAEHERSRQLVESRRDAGRVRECHGDLHCGNVVRWNGELTPFDGIEFDPALRYIDVANDLAFLTMDLAERGHGELRCAALQAWTETLGDFEGVRLLPIFEVYRALVRAKVAALRASQCESGSTERAEDCRVAERYLAWAGARMRRATPSLVLTCGYSGSGKTWLAREIGRELQALHIRSDVERKRLAGLAPLDDSRSPQDSGIYTAEYTAQTYARLHDCAAHLLRGGEPVIVDAAYLKRHERERMIALGRDLGVTTTIVHCVAPMDVLRERIGHRVRTGSDASEAGLATLERQPGYWEPFAETERGHVVTVDTTEPGAAARCIARLRQP